MIQSMKTTSNSVQHFKLHEERKEVLRVTALLLKTVEI